MTQQNNYAYSTFKGDFDEEQPLMGQETCSAFGVPRSLRSSSSPHSVIQQIINNPSNYVDPLAQNEQAALPESKHGNNKDNSNSFTCESSSDTSTIKSNSGSNDTESSSMKKKYEKVNKQDDKKKNSLCGCNNKKQDNNNNLVSGAGESPGGKANNCTSGCCCCEPPALEDGLLYTLAAVCVLGGAHTLFFQDPDASTLATALQATLMANLNWNNVRRGNSMGDQINLAKAQLSAMLASHKLDIEELQKLVEELNHKVGRVEKLIKNMKEQLDIHKAEQEKDLKLQLDIHKAELEKELKLQLDIHKAELDSKLDIYKGQLDSKLDNHKGQLDSKLDNHKGQLDSKLDNHKVQLDSKLDNHKVQLDSKLDNHHQAIKDELQGFRNLMFFNNRIQQLENAVFTPDQIQEFQQQWQQQADAAVIPNEQND